MPRRARLVGLNHVALQVGDLEEALSFYGRIFEVQLRGRVPGMVRLVRRISPRSCGIRHPLIAPVASVIRFAISSGGTSSTWVATLHRWPKGSSS